MTLLPTQTIRVDNLRLRYASDGEGEHVVFLHGFPETLQGWRHNLPEVARHFHVHAFDWPGFGDSDCPRQFTYSAHGYAEFLPSVLDHLRIQRAHIVASDISAPAALIFALEHPQRVGRLVVSSGPAAYRPQMSSWEVKALRGEIPGGEAMVHLIPRTMLRIAMYRGFHGTPAVEPEAFADYRAQLASEDVRRISLQLFHALRRDLEWLEPRLPELEAPLLAVWGEHDAFVSWRMGLLLRDRVPRSHLEIIPDAGHFVHEEAPAAYNRLVYEHLSEESFMREQLLRRS